MSGSPSPHLGRNLAPLQPFIGTGAKPIVLSNGVAFSAPFRRALLEAHGECCAYCGDALCDQTMRVDHVVPVYRDGQSTADNLVASCVACNSGKRDRDLESFRWVLAVRHSPIAGIVNAKQAKQLQQAGVQLPVTDFRFTFEEYIEATS